VVTAVLVLAGLTVAGRSVQVTVLQHDQWAERARRQHQQVIEVPGPRGSILSADGYVLATSVSRVAIQVDTHSLTYPEIFARAAAPILGGSAEDFMRRLGGGPRAVWLAQRVPQAVAEEVRSLAPGAVVLVPDFARIYPQGTVASPVVGFVGREELITVGRAGFEHHFDALLAGEPEQYLAVNDAIQRKVRLERLHRGRAGYDLELTLYARLQARCESVLAEAIAANRARAGSAVVVEAQTGKILALASLPSFDPSDPGAVPQENWRLRPVQDAIEPGSALKPMVAAAALSAGVVRPGERFDCRNRGVHVAGRWIRDHADPGIYTFDEVITYSANAGMIEVAERLQPEHLWRTLDAFGLGKRSGVGFPAEARGLLADTRSWSKMSCAGLALGQEITVSPLQLAMAYSVIANGGWLTQPQLVSPSANGSGDETTKPAHTRVMDESLARKLREMLETAVREGTGDGAHIPGFRVAGKTGTAQRAFRGTFDDEHHTAWFAGFLPMPEPRVVVVVVIENPRVEDFWASTVAAPVFADIAEAAACLLDLPPTEAGSLLPRIARAEAEATGDSA
jgi:cell division protein FtsI/penicillin-binding protein 2